MKIHRALIALLLVILLSSCSEPVEYSDGTIIVNETTDASVRFTVDTNNLTLLSIKIAEKDGEMIVNYYDRIGNLKEIDLDFSLIEDDLKSILYSLNGAMVCSNNCTIYGPISNIIITLTDGETIFDFAYDVSYENNIHIIGAYKLSGENYDFRFSDQYLLELTRIYDVIVEAYEK